MRNRENAPRPMGALVHQGKPSKEKSLSQGRFIGTAETAGVEVAPYTNRSVLVRSKPHTARQHKERV